MHLVCLEGFLKIWLRYFRVYSDIDINSSLFNKFCLGDRKKNIQPQWSPQGFWGSGENGYLFSGSLGAMVIISGDQGSKLIFLGI